MCARAVIIIGYSLKDLDIAKGFLLNSETIREKTYIVTSPDEKPLTTRRLAKFGRALPIGLEGFRSSLTDANSVDYEMPSYQYLREFSVDISNDSTEIEITGDDFIKTVITGRLEAEKIAAQPRSEGAPYYVERRPALEKLSSGSSIRYIVSSDFGNGKTSFLAEAAVRLYSEGRQVFYVETRLPDIFPEIDAALATGNPTAFLIDDVVRYRTVAAYIGARLHNQSILVCTTRGDQDAQYEQIAGEIGGAHRFVDLNALSDAEIDDWNHLLERWGYWELRAELSEEDRRRFLIDRCGRENRSIILSLFSDSRVAEKIDEIVSFFIKSHSKHLKAFCGLLISSLAQRHVSWESLVSWLGVDEDGLRSDLQKDEVSFLFSRGRMWNFFTSAQLAEYILRNKFVSSERDVLVEVYSTIVLSTAESSGDNRFGFDFRENLKELMKFRFLEKLFGENDASGLLIGRVYKNLSRARKIRENPQFWLQYAMSRIKVGDLSNAESFINTALGLAKDGGMDYNPFQIKDQRARLYFLKNTKIINVSRNEIKTALDDLIDLARDQSYDIVYTMRSLPIIEAFLEEKIDDLELATRSQVRDFVALLKEKTAGFDRLPRSQRGETKVLKKALSNIELILFNA